MPVIPTATVHFCSVLFMRDCITSWLIFFHACIYNAAESTTFHICLWAQQIGSMKCGCIRNACLRIHVWIVSIMFKLLILLCGNLLQTITDLRSLSFRWKRGISYRRSCQWSAHLWRVYFISPFHAVSFLCSASGSNLLGPISYVASMTLA